MGRRRNKNKKTKNKQIISSVKKEKIEYGKQLKLRFSPTVWAKLLYLRDIGNTEIGGFGITLENDPLYVYDFLLIEQESSMTTVDFKDEAVANFAMDMAEAGLQPAQFMRIWIHTHPNMSATPSSTDEETFNRAFGGCDWAVMAIVSNTGDQYCRIQFNNGPIAKVYTEIPIDIDYTSYNFGESNMEEWHKEYKDKVSEMEYFSTSAMKGNSIIKHLRKKQSYDWSNWDNEDIPSYDDFMSCDEDFGDFEDSDHPIKQPVKIPDELEIYMTANEYILLDDMSDLERTNLLHKLKERAEDD